MTNKKNCRILQNYLANIINKTGEIILSPVYINIMLKENQRGLLKFFTSQKVLFLGFFLILCFILYSYSSSKGNHTISGFSTGYGDSSAQGGMMMSSPPAKPVQNQAVVKPSTQPNMATVNQPIMTSAPVTGGYNAGNTVVPADLLPKDNNTQFGDFNMLNQGNIVMPDLLDAGYLIGLDTIGQTLRNANLQERSDPIIPKTNVGPWNNSTIEPDFGRVPLELGAGLQ